MTFFRAGESKMLFVVGILYYLFIFIMFPMQSLYISFNIKIKYIHHSKSFQRLYRKEE